MRFRICVLSASDRPTGNKSCPSAAERIECRIDSPRPQGQERKQLHETDEREARPAKKRENKEKKRCALLAAAVERFFFFFLFITRMRPNLFMARATRRKEEREFTLTLNPAIDLLYPSLTTLTR